MLSNKELLDRHAQLRQRRAYEEPQWREIAALIKPEEQDIGQRGKRARIGDDIFDSTPIQALDQFEGGLFTQATNPADRWFDLDLADKDLKAWGPVKDYLWRYGQLVYNSFSPAVSAFYAMIPGQFGDLGAFGLGCGYSDLAQGATRFTDLHIPLSEAFVETDGMGYLVGFNREYPRRGAQLKREFGAAAAAFRDEEELCVIHSVFENPEFKPGALGPRGMAYSSITIVDGAARDFRVTGGYFEMPYTAIPWKLRSGDRYPIGPGHLARADVNMLNEMERAHIVAGQFEAEPVLLIHDESVLTAADIEPRKLLYGTVNDSGKPLLQKLDRGSDLRLTLAQSEQRRAAIRETFLFSMMQLVNRPQMTATEFLGFKEEQLRLMGPNLARIHAYGLAPLISRRARLLQRAGMVPPPPPELRGHNIEISFISPLAKAQEAAKSRAVTQFAGAVMSWAAADPSAIDNVDFDAAAARLGDGLGVPPGVLRPPDQVAKMRQARAQAQAQQAMVAQASELSNVYANVAHANQAQTRSAQRSEEGAAA